jgi:P-type Cu+ transporter
MIGSMPARTETVQVGGIRCERCVQRLRAALQPLEGLQQANANLMGQLTLSWDDERLERDEIVRTLERAGFQPAAFAE